MWTKAKEAGSNFVSGVVDWLCQLPGKIATWFSNTIQNASTFVSNFKTKAREAGSGFVSSITGAIAGLPGKMKNFGGQIVKSVWDGITNLSSWFTSKVNGFFSGIVNGIMSGIKGNGGGSGGKNNNKKMIDVPDLPFTDGATAFTLDNVALSGSYYTATTRDSVAANNMIRQVNGSVQAAYSDRMMNSLASMLFEINKSLYELKQHDRDVTLYTTNNSYLDSKLIARETKKEVIRDINRSTNNYRKGKGGL